VTVTTSRNNKNVTNISAFDLFFIALLAVSLMTHMVYSSVDAHFKVHPVVGENIQVVWNCFDPCILFSIGNAFYGISTLGFLLPFTLMTYIVTKKSTAWGFSINQDYRLCFSVAAVVNGLFLEITPTGFSLSSIGYIIVAILSSLIGCFSMNNRGIHNAIHIFSAFWFGLALSDFSRGLYYVVDRSTVQFSVCLGGDGWGIGDGLWLTSIGMIVFYSTGLLIQSVFENRN